MSGLAAGKLGNGILFLVSSGFYLLQSIEAGYGVNLLTFPKGREGMV
jgi:hypothetical protein